MGKRKELSVEGFKSVHKALIKNGLSGRIAAKNIAKGNEHRKKIGFP